MAASPKLLREDPPNQKQIDRVYGYLKKGVLLETAVAAIGVDKKTFHRWLRAGNAGQPGFKEFTDMVDRANIEFECTLLEYIGSNANKNVHAAQWLFNLKYGPKYKKAAEAEAGIVDPINAKSPAEVSEQALEEAEARLLEQQAAH